MPLVRETRRGINKSRSRIHTLGVALAIFLFLSWAAYSPAQRPTSAAPPPAKAETTATTDPLGRETPRGAVVGALKYSERQDFATAARYMQPTPGEDLVLVARELRALHSKFEGNLALVSDDPNGTIEPGYPPGEVVAGVLAVGGTTTDVVLVRVDDPASGKIWLLSKKTVAKIPQLYAEMQSEEPTTADRIATFARGGRQLMGISLRQWLGWLLSIPISWLLASLLAILVSAPRRGWYKLRKLRFTTVWQTPIGMPLKCIIAILMHSLFVYLLEPPLLYRVYYFRFIAGLLAGCFAWLVSAIADLGFDRAVNRTRTQKRGGESILILMQRLTRVMMMIIAVVVAFAVFGFNVKTALAGLGIGGLAIALGAQKTLENLIGGVSLLMDKAVQVGNLCKIGDQIGTVEDVGLRSVKVRSLDQSLLVVPNGLLAQMQFENLSTRRKCLLNQHFSLRIETRVEQLRFVLDRVQSMLDQHPAIESGTSRIRVASFAGAAFDMEIFAFGTTGNFAQFTAVRQEVILKIAEIIEASGTRLAAPTQLTYLASDVGVDMEKADDIVR